MGKGRVHVLVGGKEPQNGGFPFREKIMTRESEDSSFCGFFLGKRVVNGLLPETKGS